MKQQDKVKTILLVAALIGIAFTNKQENNKYYDIQEDVITVVEEEVNDFYEEDYNKKTFAAFATALGHRESGNNYEIENQYGYIGRYQFGRLALKAVGLGNISKKKFKNNPSIQDKAFESLLALNKHYLRNYIDKYDGKRINGIEITESGLLAAAHLVGASSVKNYLSSNGRIIRKDGNGVKLTSYLKKFSGYDVSNIEAKSIINKDTYNLY